MLHALPFPPKYPQNPILPAIQLALFVFGRVRVLNSVVHPQGMLLLHPLFILVPELAVGAVLAMVHFLPPMGSVEVGAVVGDAEVGPGDEVVAVGAADRLELGALLAEIAGAFVVDFLRAWVAETNFKLR